MKLRVNVETFGHEGISGISGVSGCRRPLPSSRQDGSQVSGRDGGDSPAARSDQVATLMLAFTC